ncbi:MAG: hypothetical protein HOQ22_11260 [Nocardioidaceae bacterium]|nr:hypothetical protein [Nocardioidaceae bacterium]NUS51605.1 hypothetical protein [Nocardioidaceae bacterium]
MRVTVAVALMGVATVAVLAALPTQNALLLSVASLVALGCGWAAARIVYSELAQSRRDAATDRAGQAQAYRVMFELRAREHAEFTTSITDKLARGAKEITSLEDTVLSAEKRAMEAEARVQREARRANDAQERVHELTERVDELELASAERADELAIWNAGADTPDVDGELVAVVDLLAWEERVAAAHQQHTPEQKQA